ncbi:MAG: hypothetical protein NC121_20675 [Blautia sp.]|nr:hypothetical protein [Blautia sp.]
MFVPLKRHDGKFENKFQILIGMRAEARKGGVNMDYGGQIEKAGLENFVIAGMEEKK